MMAPELQVNLQLITAEHFFSPQTECIWYTVPVIINDATHAL